MVSIIIPVYNVELYICKCLDSCLSQTYHNIEIIAIDDGSKDNSGLILDMYSQKDSRIKVIHQSNKGVVIAREEGIKIAKGNYITFVDSDDYIDKDFIEKLVIQSQQHDCDIVTCGYRIVDENYRLLQNRDNILIGKLQHEVISSLLLRTCTWALWGKLYKKELFNSIKTPYGQKMGEDGVISFQLFEKASHLETINEPLYNYLQRNNSVMRQKNNSLSLDIIKFVNFVKTSIVASRYKEILNKEYRTFLASQIYVYFFNGGNIEYLFENIEERFSIKEILSYRLSVIEKIIVISIFKSKTLCNILYNTYKLLHI